MKRTSYAEKIDQTAGHNSSAIIVRSIAITTKNHHQFWSQWIGLRENFNRKAPYLMGKSMVSG